MKKIIFSYILLPSFFLLIGQPLHAMKRERQDPDPEWLPIQKQTKKQKIAPAIVPVAQGKIQAGFCNRCRKYLTSSTGMKFHLMNHQGIQPYNCTECDKKYTQKCNLIKHIENHHPKKIKQNTVVLKKKRQHLNLIDLSNQYLQQEPDFSPEILDLIS